MKAKAIVPVLLLLLVSAIYVIRARAAAPSQPGVFDCSTSQGKAVTAFVQMPGGKVVAVNLCAAASDKELRQFQRDLRKSFRSLTTKKNGGAL